MYILYEVTQYSAGVGKITCGCCQPNPGPLQEQHALFTAEPSLQSCLFKKKERKKRKDLSLVMI